MKQTFDLYCLPDLPTRYKWYAGVLAAIAVLTVALLAADFSSAPSPARTAVPMEQNPDHQPSSENNKPMADEGGPYR